MSYQAVLGFYEQLVITALAPLPVHVNNQFMEGFDAEDEFGLVRVNFGLTTELNVGCGPAENLRGSLVCEVYTRKGTGPGRGARPDPARHPAAQRAQRRHADCRAGRGGQDQ